MSSALPFVGSKISLISKSDIRYVGTLHSINQQESTVSLEQVRSYGTEGRKKDKSEEISGTDQIYEYIVFRGSDIKDLQVCEAPPARPPQVPKDPAILGTTAPSTIPPGFPMMQGLDGNMLPPNLQMPLNGVNPYIIQMYQQQLWQQQLQQQQQQQPAAALLKSNEPPVSVANPATNIISAMENLNINKEAENKNAAKPKEESSTQQSKTTNENSPVENTQQNGANNNRAQNNSNMVNHNRNYNQNNRFQRGGRQNNYRRGMNSRGRRNWNNSKQIPLPDSDFDFETANAKFKELSNKESDKTVTEVKKEQDESINSPEVEVPEENGSDDKAGNFYNKSSSFFDNISCESKERSEEQGKKFDRRTKQYEERKLNMETFGQATVNRGGHRGYRRNNYHSYRGGRNNYNRNGGYHRNNGYRNNYYNNNNRQKSQDQQQQNQNNNQQPQQQKQEATPSQ